MATFPRHAFRSSFLAAVLGLVLPTSAWAQGTDWFDSYRTFSIYLENDALAKWRPETTDESYTQGLRFTWEFAVWPQWAEAVQRRISPLRAEGECLPPKTRAAGGCGTVSFGLGQTIYSPIDIITPRLQTNDQPFAGWLFGTVGLNVRQGRWQSTTDLVVGVTGPPAFARNTQSLAHWTWAQGSAKPGGWDNQLKGAVHVGAMQTYAVHALEWCLSGVSGCSGGSGERRVFDLSPRSEVVLTTTMARVSGGAVVRAGYGFPDAIGQRIPATGKFVAPEPSRWWFGVFAGADRRWVGYNGFLSGTYADGGATGWRTVGRIEPRRFVDEASVGLSIGNGAVALSAVGVWRSLEWDPMAETGQPARRDGRHSYLSLKLSLNSGR